ncbi:MAG TPA: hypothetical protein VLD36_06215 [Burkholderiales bacterium]|nr:hypothetical protein [Burkholderiales bacterium]
MPTLRTLDSRRLIDRVATYFNSLLEEVRGYVTVHQDPVKAEYALERIAKVPEMLATLGRTA